MARESHIEYPNRDKTSSKVTKLIVVALLVATAALMAIVTIAGWSTLQGAKSVGIGYILIFLICAVLIARWRSGLLPVSAALAMILLIFAAVAGPQWFGRGGGAYDEPALPSDVLGFITLIIVPVQILLIGFAMNGFRQRWQTEVEVDDSEDDREHSGDAVPATA